MTQKRYRKLGYALLQRMNIDHINTCGTKADDWGKVLKEVQKIEIKNTKFTSYADAWESLKPIRKVYGMN